MSNAPKKKFKPKENYAIAPAKIVTLYQGRRLVKFYESGQRLKGVLLTGRYAML